MIFWREKKKSFSFSSGTESINLLSPQKSSGSSEVHLGSLLFVSLFLGGGGVFVLKHKQDKLDLSSNTLKYLMKKLLVSEFSEHVLPYSSF